MIQRERVGKRVSLYEKLPIQMPRPKKDGRYLNLYLDRALHEEFEQFCESPGQTKKHISELKKYDF